MEKPVRKVYMTKKRKGYLLKIKLIIVLLFAIMFTAIGWILCAKWYNYQWNKQPDSVVDTLSEAQNCDISNETVKVDTIYLPPSKELVINEIIKQANEYGVSVYEALEVSRCESNYNAFAKSKKSSATGVYQFIDSTWEDYCDGDRLNFKDNIKCFMELYEDHKSWWECRVN